MANDILTNVEQARKEVLDIVAAYGIQNDERGPFAQYVDALIAAVRAEEQAKRKPPPTLSRRMMGS